MSDEKSYRFLSQYSDNFGVTLRTALMIWQDIHGEENGYDLRICLKYLLTIIVIPKSNVDLTPNPQPIKNIINWHSCANIGERIINSVQTT